MYLYLHIYISFVHLRIYVVDSVVCLFSGIKACDLLINALNASHPQVDVIISTFTSP